MEKYQIKVNNIILNADSLKFSYAQQDGDSAGRSEDGTMYRDVIGLINKVTAEFKYKSGNELTTLLNIVKHTKSANITYIDPSDGQVTKKMYVTSDDIDVLLIDGVFVAEPFSLKFIQMKVDEV